MQSPKQFLLIVGLAGFCSLAWAPLAKADVLYNLSGISFNDGGNLSGTFSINVYGQVAGPPFGSAYSLTTTTGSILAGNIYQSGQIPSAFLPNPPDLVVTFRITNPAPTTC
jgi:hypothetical protein